MANEDLTRYRQGLEAIELHLRHFGDPRWPDRLRQWIADFDRLPQERSARLGHYERTRRALGGMGSIADIVIAPEAGYRIIEDEREIKAANQRLLQLVNDLDAVIERILSR